MKQVLLVLLLAALAGCATSKAVLPSLEGKPRIRINQTVPSPVSVNSDTRGE